MLIQGAILNLLGNRCPRHLTTSFNPKPIMENYHSVFLAVRGVYQNVHQGLLTASLTGTHADVHAYSHHAFTQHLLQGSCCALSARFQG